MKGSDIRQKFLEYFEKNGHKIVHSSPLLPANDPTLLFTNAGMNQFKDVFTGVEKRDYKRATTSQKCIRAGGKHNDLDEVGKTARHHTFFEMLGNFSFGDYFKEDAINFAWDFLVNELGLEENRLWFSYFGGDVEVPMDEEARDLWIKVGASPDRVLPFGRKDNFWQMGDTGPCGPCSEIHYYMGDDPENPEKNHPKYVNGEGDTTMEIWNLVFMQFERSADGNGGFKLENLPAPSVDTGAGLERMAVVLQGVKSNYDTDLIKPIINKTAELAERFYEAETQSGFAMRVVADHARATAFAIADGILPGNNERNYVLRKIMRRAIYHGREHLGFQDLFFHKVCDFVIDLMKDAYPELETQRDFIGKMVRLEEERFGATMTVGLKKLDELFSGISLEQKVAVMANFSDDESIEKIRTGGNAVDVIKANPQMQEAFNSEEAKEILAKQGFGENEFLNSMENLAQDEEIQNFVVGMFHSMTGSFFTDLAKLYDTFGTPKDLIRVKLEEFLQTSVPEEKFNQEIDRAIVELQQNSEIGKTKQAEKIKPIYAELQNVGIKSNFRGYGYGELTVDGAKVLALVKNDEQVDALDVGDEGLIVLDETPFYAEAGGQVGDTGMIVSTVRVSGRLGNENQATQNENEKPPAHADGTDVRVRVFDTFAPIQGITLHKSKVEKGVLRVGDVVTAKIDDVRRDAIRRNHTGTHLVHSALREVLGTHVKQAGSVVAPDYLRFDFSHYQPISAEEFKQIEELVAREILKNSRMETKVMSIDDAKKTGAMALFGEKYGSDVRVVFVGDGEFSKELCGGTHVNSTGDIGLFRITTDEAVASGVRRIRAITGLDAIERFREDEELIAKSLQALKTQRDNLPNAIERLQEELKRLKRENDDLKMKIATGAVGGASSDDEAKEISGVKVIAKTVEGLDKGGMRHLSDTLMAKIKSGVVILARTEEEKVSFIVRVSDDLTGKVKAGEIVKQIAPIVGGRGGGKADMAEGGGTDASKLNDALEASYQAVEQMMN